MTQKLSTAEALQLLLLYADYQAPLGPARDAEIGHSIPGEVLEQCRETRRAANVTPGEEFLIWSHEHAGWWGPARHGYTLNLEAAGIYSWAEAREICEQAGWTTNQHAPNEIPVRRADVLQLDVAPWKER